MRKEGKRRARREVVESRRVVSPSRKIAYLRFDVPRTCVDIHINTYTQIQGRMYVDVEARV